jgi:pimeloyl-ACP methyl ester carboxylesterase
MPILHHGDAEIHYEEFGSGYPILLFAPGGLRSQLAFWHHSPSNPKAEAVWMDPTVVLADRYRVIAMDQRNAGASRAPIRATDDWQTFASDHIALMDHLGIDRFHVMGGCIGSTFCLTLCERIPERISAAVLQNPIGLSDNRKTFDESFRGWSEEIRQHRPELDEATLSRFDRNLYAGDFVFSVTRDFVKRCTVPLLVMPGNDAPHPTAIGEEIVSLAPHVDVLRDWKGPAHKPASIERVRKFLAEHTPGKR